MMSETSRRSISALVREHKFNVISYAVLALGLLSVWHFISDKDFSFLLTLGSALTTFAFAVLAARTRTQLAATGLSMKCLQAYAIVFGARLISILVYEGYLPYDRSGDWFYRATEVCSFLCVLYLLFYIQSRMTNVADRGAYNPKLDVFGDIPPVPAKFGVVWLAGPTLLLALILHPNLNGNFLTDTAWAWALYLEAVAIIPQLSLFNKRGGALDEMLANSIFALGVARLLHLVFWLLSYSELNDIHRQNFTAAYPGYLVMLSQIVQLGLMTNYLRLFLTSAQKKQAMSVLPL